jgi:hypothetical protein
MTTPQIKKLTKDTYKQPKYTYTEKLTKEEIASKLEDYKKVNDISTVLNGTHLRYFITKDGKKLFRMGGHIINKDGLPEYIVLSNGKNSWSVQLDGTTFFQKMSNLDMLFPIDFAYHVFEKQKLFST